MKPLMFDLYCGLGGATEGFLAENWDCIGIDIERHVYGESKYPAQLWIQDLLTVDGAQLKDADFLWASPPCQFFSYTAMPWSRAKALAAEVRADPARLGKEMALFNACFRIQREASEAAGRHIPMVIENVRGAIPWVGRSRANFGSYHLWGDVPALMPMVAKRAVLKTGIAHRSNGATNFHGHKNPGFRFDGSGRSMQSESVDRHIKNTGGSWFAIGSPGQKETGKNPVHGAIKNAGHINKRDGHGHTQHLTNPTEHDGVKQHKSGRAWFSDPDSISGSTSSKSNARKAASARIAKIPLPLSRWIASVYYPREEPWT